jgi:hypothetical protein
VKYYKLVSKDKLSGVKNFIWTEDDKNTVVARLKVLAEIVDIEEITLEEYLILKMSGEYDVREKSK